MNAFDTMGTAAPCSARELAKWIRGTVLWKARLAYGKRLPFALDLVAKELIDRGAVTFELITEERSIYARPPVKLPRYRVLLRGNQIGTVMRSEEHMCRKAGRLVARSWHRLSWWSSAGGYAATRWAAAADLVAAYLRKYLGRASRASAATCAPRVRGPAGASKHPSTATRGCRGTTSDSFEWRGKKK